MQEKTIKSILTKKINDWADSVDDEEIKKIILNNSIIAGGSITSLLLNEKPNDYDIYFRNKEALLRVCIYYASKFKKYHTNDISCIVLDGAKTEGLADDRVKMRIMSDGIVGNLPSHEDKTDIVDDVIENNETEVEKGKYLPVYITSNAITLSDKIQIVVRFYGEPDEIHENYDYEHTKSYFSSWDRTLSIPKSVYECVMNKVLRYTGSKYPICSVFRMRKFIERGWSINAGQILKMAFHINELDLFDIDVLEDQLIGVDSAYFNNLIEQIKNQQSNDSEFQWDFSYLVKIIDKIF